MNRRLSIFCVVLALIGVPSLMVAIGQDVDRETLWKRVEEAMKKGLPKTAIKSLDPIIESAMGDKDYDEAIKAIGRKIALEGTIQGNKPEEKITRLEVEIKKAPAELKPVMQAILAHWYWHYFQQNRWRFMQRTQTAQPPGEDLQTWDLPTILAEIDKHFTAALENEQQLKQTPVSAYSELLTDGTVPDKYRPTMYDFLAQEAIAFYTAGEQAGAAAQDAFELDADGPIFAAADGFLNWEVKTTDERSPIAKAIRLMQKLMRFHEKDDDKTAFLDIDLQRLRFGYNKAFGEEKKARYKAALGRWADKHAQHPLSSLALAELAGVIHSEGDFVEARKIALQGKTRFPDSVGGHRCHNLIAQIEASSSRINIERVWSQPWPDVEVRYRNLTKVYFRVVSFEWLQQLRNNRRPGQLSQQEREQLLARRPALSFSRDLPETKDYQERVETIKAPEDLKPGSYFLISSHNEQFNANDNMVSFASFWVSEMAIVVRTRYSDPEIGGFVLKADSGEPLAGATVQAWRLDRQSWSKLKEVKTDENGLFNVKGVNRTNAMLYVTAGEQKLASGRMYYLRQYDARPKQYRRTVFFTDRSLYRPGQTVQYKGLSIEVDPREDNYEVIPNYDVTVVFSDRNNKEIARQKHRTNEYGSFNGSFTAPRNRLMGNMRIYVDGPASGAAHFNVEEYKRPKFKVAIEAPEKPGKLNAEIKMTGKATAYTGAAIDGAQVRWRVVREVRYPYWFSYRFWWMPRQGNRQEIAHGVATTTKGGEFEVDFVARPDRSVPEKNEPTFNFVVYADVTDSTGETRSADRSVQLGYTALKAMVTAEDWQTVDKPVQLKIQTSTLDGDGESAEGVVKIYRLKQPEKVQRPSLSGSRQPIYRGGRIVAPEPDPSNINSWELGELVEERGFTTDEKGQVTLDVKLAAGAFRVKLETNDRFGKPVTAELPVQVFDPEADKFAIKVPNLVAAPAWSLEPGKEFMAIWGSGYDQARAFVEIEHRQKTIQSYWTKRGVTQVQVKQAITEAQRGGFTLRVTMVRENRAHITNRRIDVPWSNKDLKVRWERFVSKLTPAKKETWTAVITGPDAKKVSAEMVAGLYDVSLDAFRPHQWQQKFNVFRFDNSNLNSVFENQLQYLNYLKGNFSVITKPADRRYRSFPRDVVMNWQGYQMLRKSRRSFGAAPGAPAPMEAQAARGGAEQANDKQMDAAALGADAEGGAKAGGPDLSNVSARTNLNETAFFFPHLVSNKDGEVRMEFTMPEALTEWRFLGFAHDAKLRSGYLEDKVVTSKDLMVQPNPPRFVREGDVLEFTVKVTNQSPTRQRGKVRLSFSDARTGAVVDGQLGNSVTDKVFDIPSKESLSCSWKLDVPDDMGFLVYKAVGASDRLSDGEEGYLPVLSRRILVTESKALPLRGKQTKQFEFERLMKSGDSDTLKHKSVTVQMVSNPSWYAVLALPYLMEFPHECNEQIFNRLYANAVARHVANSDPKIRRVFDLWKGTEALDSPLEKNEDLKAVMLEETPWLRDAMKESEARRNVGILFDDNRLNAEVDATLRKLAEAQYPDGGWPWFPGGRANDFITLYIATGFGRMRHLGVDIDIAPATKACKRMDAWLKRTYDKIKPEDRDKNHMNTMVAFYLYGRSFFLKDAPIDAAHKPAVDYFLGQARKYWLQVANRQSQAHIAVGLLRFGDETTPPSIMRSIKERSVSDAELGMFWRELEKSWWWYRAPIETQAMMIEAFDEVMDDQEAVEDCKVWLVKQKQTQDWKTTKATADAVYALLLRGNNLLASDALVKVALGGETIEPEKVEAGTGFYSHRYTGGEVEPKLGEIKVTKVDEGVSWGSVHWQYLEDMSKVTPYDGTPLRLKKDLFIKENTEKGPTLKAVKGALKVGDELVVRVVLRTDRDMEYVHLKDQRASGTEPVNVLSKYKYQDGLGYYESTRDTASHFFIDYLPKGVYVFEYSTRVVHEGKYQTGVAQIQCMYAPEFNSHSESHLLTVE